MITRACPLCSGPMSPLHEETTIRLGQPVRVRHRYRCLDSGCPGSTSGDEVGPVAGSPGSA